MKPLPKPMKALASPETELKHICFLLIISNSHVLFQHWIRYACLDNPDQSVKGIRHQRQQSSKQTGNKNFTLSLPIKKLHSYDYACNDTLPM